MKKITVLFTSIILSACAFAQIPNSGFESWTNKGIYEVPDQWGTLNNATALLGVYTVTKGTPGSSGSYYMKLTSKTVSTVVINAIAVCGKLDSITMLPKSGFAYTGQPKSFTGKWQYMTFGNSPGSVSATLTKWNTVTKQREVIATATQTLTGMVMNNWASFTINFSYISMNVPDSCIIFLAASGSSPTANDYLYVDDLAFTGSVAGVQNHPDFLNNMSVYPNPSNKNVTVDFNLNKTENVKIQLIDLRGTLVKEVDLGSVTGSNKYSLPGDGVTQGEYFINLITNEGAETKKIIIQ